jgi:hypothetical protein
MGCLVTEPFQYTGGGAPRISGEGGGGQGGRPGGPLPKSGPAYPADNPIASLTDNPAIYLKLRNPNTTSILFPCSPPGSTSVLVLRAICTPSCMLHLSPSAFASSTHFFGPDQSCLVADVDYPQQRSRSPHASSRFAVFDPAHARDIDRHAYHAVPSVRT